jgi:hypothetical protein
MQGDGERLLNWNLNSNPIVAILARRSISLFEMAATWALKFIVRKVLVC